MKINKDIIKRVGLLVQAIEDLEEVFTLHNNDLPGPAYLKLDYFRNGKESLQMDRPIFCNALREQISKYEVALAELGFTI